MLLYNYIQRLQTHTVLDIIYLNIIVHNNFVDRICRKGWNRIGNYSSAFDIVDFNVIEHNNFVEQIYHKVWNSILQWFLALLLPLICGDFPSYRKLKYQYENEHISTYNILNSVWKHTFIGFMSILGNDSRTLLIFLKIEREPEWRLYF